MPPNETGTEGQVELTDLMTEAETDEGTLEREEDSTPGDAKFERRGFAKAADEGEAEVSEETEKGEADPDRAMAAADEAKAAKIRIGDKTFETQDEAWAYAEELQRKDIASDAFRQGLEAAAKTDPGNTKAEPEEDNFEEEFYANPKEFLKKEREKIRAELKAEVFTDLDRKEKSEQTWNEFYSDYPDLGNVRELVNIVMAQEWETVKHLEAKVALKRVAEKTREKRKAFAQDLIPKQEMRKTRTAASPGSPAGVTQKEEEEKPLNFAAQIRQNKAKRAQLL